MVTTCAREISRLSDYAAGQQDSPGAAPRIHTGRAHVGSLAPDPVIVPVEPMRVWWAHRETACIEIAAEHRHSSSRVVVVGCTGSGKTGDSYRSASPRSWEPWLRRRAVSPEPVLTWPLAEYAWESEELASVRRGVVWE